MGYDHAAHTQGPVEVFDCNQSKLVLSAAANIATEDVAVYICKGPGIDADVEVAHHHDGVFDFEERARSPSVGLRIWYHARRNSWPHREAVDILVRTSKFEEFASSGEPKHSPSYPFHPCTLECSRRTTSDTAACFRYSSLCGCTQSSTEA